MAAETSLSRQLKKLAVPQTTLLIQDKIKKSFLFDHREAASLDRDIIFSYGTTGLEKLKTINPRFGKFENDLFSVTYKDFERSMQTTSINQKLDEMITEFLRMLSPYFLIRAAHESLEWLICRFHVHLYNIDALIASVLPYYNTSTFVRVIQLLSIDDPNCRWHWLLPVQKTGVHLEFSAIINCFNSDRNFRKLVCDLAPNSLEVFPKDSTITSAIVSFSMLTIYSALGRKDITDSTIMFLFPYILKGLKSNVDKYIAATYLVISKIVSNVKLEDALVAEIILKVLTNVKVEFSKEAFGLILLIFQQQPISKLPKEHFKLFLSQKTCLEHLVELSESYEVTSLLSALIKECVPNLLRMRSVNPKLKKTKALLKFTMLLISNISLNETTVALSVKCILRGYAELPKSLNFKCMKETSKMLLKSLEVKYPVQFDNAINQCFRKNNKDTIKCYELINESVCSVKNKILLDRQTTLALGVNHVNDSVRKVSVKYLMELATLNQLSDKDFIENAFCDRLRDDSPKVVREVIKYPEILLLYVDKKKLLGGFSYILSHQINEDSLWYQLQICSIHILCEHFSYEKELAFDIFSTIMPFIFPLNKNSAVGFLRIVKSELAKLLPIVQAFEISYTVDFDGDTKNDNEQLFLLNNTLMMSLQKYIENLNDEEKCAFLTFLKEKSGNLESNSFFVLFVFGTVYAIVSNVNPKLKCHFIQNFLCFLDTFHCSKTVFETFTNDMTEKTVIEKCIDSLWNNRFPYLIIYNAFYNIAKFAKLECDFTKSTSWLLTENSAEFVIFNTLIDIFKFCIKQKTSQKESISENFKNLSTVFIDSQFETTEQLFGFLSLLWSDCIGNLPVILQIAALETAKLSLDDAETCRYIFENYSIYIRLLMAICSEVDVRKVALSLLSSMMQMTENNFTLCSMTEAILNHEVEIITDSKECYSIINNWFNPIIEIYNPTQFPSIKETNMKLKYEVLDNFIKVLSENGVTCLVQKHVLLCLQGSNSFGILSAFVPIIDNLLTFYEENGKFSDESSFNTLELLLKQFTPKTAVNLKSSCPETSTFFKCLQIIEKSEANDKDIVALVTKLLTRDFFKAIPSIPVKKKVLDILLSAYLTAPPNVNSELHKVLCNLCTYAYLILKDLLGKGTAILKGSTLREMKKSKVQEESMEESTKLFENENWKKIIVLLELIQGESELDKHDLLIPELFNLLNKTLNYESLTMVEYLRRLILSSIFNCCQYLGKKGLNEREFQVELIVQCIRSSTNPKTHHQALLLLNLAATIFPDYVLNNVMSIFTFMGSSLVRQDDSYSFQVISQTIETIVPSLLEASSQRKENDGMQIVASVIRVFVDSLSDMPRHRQLPLFSKLVTTMDPSKYLWVPLAQICDQYATVFTDMALTDVEDGKISPTLDFAINLNKQFSPLVQMDTCINLLNFLTLLPDSKEDSDTSISTQNFTEPFNVGSHSKQQLQVYKYNILAYINLWLSSPVFMSQVADLDTKRLNNLEKKYETLLEKTLQYLEHQRNLEKKAEDIPNRHSLVTLLFELVGHVNALLPSSLFIRVVRHLLDNPEITIQKKAIELLNFKLEQQQHFFQEEHYKPLLRLLKPLLEVVQKYKETKSTEDENPIVNQQTALYSLHLLTKIIGSKYSSKFQKVLNVVIQVLKDNSNEELTVNALLCLAQLCKSLNVKVLTKLNSFMPIIVENMVNNKILEMNDCLILGILTALMSLIENLGGFLSGYMQSIVSSVCILTRKYLSIQKKTIHEKLLSFQTLLAKDVDLRILLTAIEKSYLDIHIKDPNCVTTLMNLFEEKLAYSSYEDIKEYSSIIQQFSVVLLNFRNSVTEKNILLESITNIELSIFAAVKAFVMKLPVTHFQNFFKHIYLWATANEVKQKLRIFTFYGLTNQLAKALKNLFVVVVRSFLKHAALELVSNNSSKTEDLNFKDSFMTTQHVNNIVDTLYTSFAHDSGQLLDKDTFDFLMEPLVDQLENLYDDEEAYQDRISKHLSVCIAHFMAAVSDNALWKKLNYQILLKTRHDSPLVRFAAIQVVREVVTVMGDNYLVLLPESIPFLAEVMEDESAEVEQECNLVITDMEKILGEPIRKYF